MRAAIGPYGAAHTERLIRAASVMCSLIHEDVQHTQEIGDKVDEHLDVVENHTPRGTSSRRLTAGVIYSNRESMAVTSQEGMVSILGALSMIGAKLMIDSSGEVVDGSRLIETSLEEDYVNQLAMLFQQAVVGSAGTFSSHIPDMMQMEGDTPRIDPNLASRLAPIRKSVIRILHARLVEYKHIADTEGVEVADRTAPTTGTGVKCPAAGSYAMPDGQIVDGSITNFSRAFLDVYRLVKPATPEQQRSAIGIPWKVPRLL